MSDSYMTHVVLDSGNFLVLTGLFDFKHRLQGRNRRCITVDMRQDEGRDIIRQLANKVDVLVENFRPGVMEKWKLGPQVSDISSCCSFT